MLNNIKKIIVSGLFVAVLFFGQAGSVGAATDYELSLRMQAVERQILLLRIQYIQQRIAELQEQLAKILASEKAFIDVIYPNGGEKIENQRGYYIRWESKSIDKVTIKLDDNRNITTIASNVNAAEGRYYWNVGNISGDNYRIRIFDASKDTVTDESNGTFAIFDNSDGNKCSDGTVVGKCSTDKPKLCFDTDIDLTDACHSCGCPSGETCRPDGSCN